MATSDVYERRFGEDVPGDTTSSCQECGGRVRTNAVETTCEDCVFVLDETPIDHGPEWRSSGDDEKVAYKAAITPSRAGEYFAASREEFLDGTVEPLERELAEAYDTSAGAHPGISTSYEVQGGDDPSPAATDRSRALAGGVITAMDREIHERIERVEEITHQPELGRWTPRVQTAFSRRGSESSPRCAKSSIVETARSWSCRIKRRALRLC
jgi:transcription initiation factor TFIIIB Brf1 subunit/transcription initiation factor TFIIB